MKINAVVWLCVAMFLGAGCGSGDDGPGTAQPGTTGQGGTVEPTTAEQNSSTESATPLPDPELLPEEEYLAGWIQLFDGQTLFGWETAGSDGQEPVNWRVEDGMIVADEGGTGLLLTTSPFADFELRCEFRLAEGGNSGIFLRTVPQPTDPATDCYELNICDTREQFATGSLVGRTEPLQKVEGDGQWRTFHVTARGRNITARLDDQEVLNFTDDTDAARWDGRIGLQHNEGRIEFRHVSLRPLGGRALFDGETLLGWREVPGSKGEFSVTDETIQVKGGAGFLETVETWGDFILQTQVKTLADNVNGGIFFRAQEGTLENPSGGYELQVHNGFADGDRTKPNDYGTGFGTGAIFRRQKARRVVGDDQQWQMLTLVARGSHFASWVNGCQVTDWTDDREPDPNPRRGLRLDPGHISLQGHDETTQVQFRDVKIYPRDELPVPESGDDSDDGADESQPE